VSNCLAKINLHAWRNVKLNKIRAAEIPVGSVVVEFKIIDIKRIVSGSPFEGEQTERVPSINDKPPNGGVVVKAGWRIALFCSRPSTDYRSWAETDVGESRALQARQIRQRSQTQAAAHPEILVGVEIRATGSDGPVIQIIGR